MRLCDLGWSEQNWTVSWDWQWERILTQKARGDELSNDSVQRVGPAVGGEADPALLQPWQEC